MECHDGKIRRLSQTVSDARKRIEAAELQTDNTDDAMECHKGKTCVIESRIFCQEGYCSECEIARKADEVLR